MYEVGGICLAAFPVCSDPCSIGMHFTVFSLTAHWLYMHGETNRILTTSKINNVFTWDGGSTSYLRFLNAMVVCNKRYRKWCKELFNNGSCVHNVYFWSREFLIFNQSDALKNICFKSHKAVQKNNENYTVFSVASFEISVKQSEQATKLSFNTSTWLVRSKTLMTCLLNTLCGALGW